MVKCVSLKKTGGLALILITIAVSFTPSWAALNQRQVSQLYVSIFGRASEGEGNGYWQTAYGDMVTTANMMLGSPAAIDYFGASLNSNQAFIEHIYRNTLNKTIQDDPEGILYWTGRLNAGESRGAVAVAMIGAIESFAPGGPNYTPEGGKAMDAYNQFANRVTVSNHMADTVFTAPPDWATSTAFEKGLKVTFDETTMTRAIERVETLDSQGLESEVRRYMAMATSVDDVSAVTDEVQVIFGEITNAESPVVTITPPLTELLNMTDMPSNITCSLDFGSGYTPEGGKGIYTGSAIVNISDVQMGESRISARASMTANNVQRDGEQVLAGGMNMVLNVIPSGTDIVVNADVNFANLKSLTYVVNGGISLSTTASSDAEDEETAIELKAPLVITFDNFTTSEFTASGTVTITQVSEKRFEVDLDFTTDEGMVKGTVRIDGQSDTQFVISTPSGPLSVEGNIVTINDVLLDSEICEEFPAGGNIVVTGASETNTVVFSECSYTVN